LWKGLMRCVGSTAICGPACWRGVPTNLVVGMGVRAVMGGGIAKQAAVRYPVLPGLYGAHLKGNLRRHLYWWRLGGIICLPTKVHWREDSDLELLEDGLRQLRTACLVRTLGDIRLPRIGAGLGRLPWAVVEQSVVRTLGDLPNVVLVQPASERARSRLRNEQPRAIPVVKAMRP